MNETLQGNGIKIQEKKGREIGLTIKAMTKNQFFFSFFCDAKLTPPRFYRINGWSRNQ
jgi:hypothetical protein